MAQPWFPLYPTDYLADTRDLSAAAHGVYLLLLMESWIRGPLPDSPKRLRRWAADAPEKVVMMVLQRHWILKSDGWVNNRLEIERDKARAFSERQKANIIKRWSIPRYDSGITRAIPEPYQDDTRAPDPQPQPQEDLRSPPDSASDKSEATSVGVITAPKGRADPCPYQAIADLWNETCGAAGLPRCEKLTETRRRHVKARWCNGLGELPGWGKFFRYILESDFLAGRAPTRGRAPFRASFDWVVKPENYAKIYEGRYHAD